MSKSFNDAYNQLRREFNVYQQRRQQMEKDFSDDFPGWKIMIHLDRAEPVISICELEEDMSQAMLVVVEDPFITTLFPGSYTGFQKEVHSLIRKWIQKEHNYDLTSSFESSL